MNKGMKTLSAALALTIGVMGAGFVGATAPRTEISDAARLVLTSYIGTEAPVTFDYYKPSTNLVDFMKEMESAQDSLEAFDGDNNAWAMLSDKVCNKLQELDGIKKELAEIVALNKKAGTVSTLDKDFQAESKFAKVDGKKIVPVEVTVKKEYLKKDGSWTETAPTAETKDTYKFTLPKDEKGNDLTNEEPTYVTKETESMTEADSATKIAYLPAGTMLFASDFNTFKNLTKAINDFEGKAKEGKIFGEFFGGKTPTTVAEEAKELAANIKALQALNDKVRSAAYQEAVTFLAQFKDDQVNTTNVVLQQLANRKEAIIRIATAVAKKFHLHLSGCILPYTVEGDKTEADLKAEQGEKKDPKGEKDAVPNTAAVGSVEFITPSFYRPILPIVKVVVKKAEGLTFNKIYQKTITLPERPVVEVEVEEVNDDVVLDFSSIIARAHQ